MERVGGTRFRLFPQAPVSGSDAKLETVTVSSPAGSLWPGPSDERMYTVVPLGKREPYGLRDGPNGQELYLPPWEGPAAPPALPSPEGHFDHIPVTAPQFPAAHLFGCARFTMDVWEKYIGGPVAWHFDDYFERLQLSLLPGWENAQLGFGFLETGEREGPDGLIDEYALNFDVVAHEIGHALVLALSGPFVPGETTGEIEAFHEMSSDWVALIAALHFDSVVNELLDSTFGDLDSFNRLSRFAEVSSNSQIRLANNKRTLYDFEAGWKSEHDVAKPLIGAFFDTFIDIYHELLVEYGAIPPSLERLADAAERDRSLRTRMRRGFQLAYDRRPDLFRMALRGSRDIIARTLARFLYDLDSEKDVFQYFWTLLSNGTVHQCTFAESIFGDHFKRRGIGQTVLGPRIEKGSIRSHTRSTRLTIPRTVNETGVSERFY